MYTKMCFASIVFLLMFSCCSNKNTTSNKELNYSKTMNMNVYERVSENRIKDSLKMADTPYIYDYEVSNEKKININEDTASRLEMLVNDKANFYDDKVLNQCNPKPDFFIEWKNGTVYGFHLESNCPVMYEISYKGTQSTMSKKYILNDKKVEFVLVTDLIKTQ